MTSFFETHTWGKHKDRIKSLGVSSIANMLLSAMMAYLIIDGDIECDRQPAILLFVATSHVGSYCLVYAWSIVNRWQSRQKDYLNLVAILLAVCLVPVVIDSLILTTNVHRYCRDQVDTWKTIFYWIISVIYCMALVLGCVLGAVAMFMEMKREIPKMKRLRAHRRAYGGSIQNTIKLIKRDIKNKGNVQSETSADALSLTQFISSSKEEQLIACTILFLLYTFILNFRAISINKVDNEIIDTTNMQLELFEPGTKDKIKTRGSNHDQVNKDHSNIGIVKQASSRCFKCHVCDSHFDQGDLVTVCPACTTAYHTSCLAKLLSGDLGCLKCDKHQSLADNLRYLIKDNRSKKAHDDKGHVFDRLSEGQLFLKSKCTHFR